MENYTLPEGKVLVLRSCKPDMSSQNNFVWPTEGPVKCPDWKDNNECGNGLHGWLWGTGNFSLKYKEVGARWLVVEVNADDIRELGKEKVKYPEGNVLFTGTFKSTYDFVMKYFWLQHAAEIKAGEIVDQSANISNEDEVSVVNTVRKGHASASGDSGHASASGNSGHASASGDSGHASASGNSGHASASGYYGHASASGNSGHASASGNSGHASASGYYGHASASGDSGHASASGNSGHASASGNSGHASASGYSGHASASGNSGHASASGNSGHASASGYYGHASASGYYGHASASGDYGHASASGYYGHASASGYSGHACVLGRGGRAQCGDNGAIILTYWDETAKRNRHVIGYAGENGIEAGKLYRLNTSFEFEEVKQ
jgi:hypothetical protein